MKNRHYLPIVLLLFVAACSPSTQLSKSWMDPSVKASTWKPFKKVLTMGLVKDEGTRRMIEDKLAAQLPAGRAIPSYSYLTAADTVDAQVEAKLIKDGFDGVILMRLANVEQSVSYVPGTTYGGFYGYRGYGYGGYGTQGYYDQDKTYNVETNIYTLNPPKLVWAGTTASMNPSKVSGTMDDIIATIKAEFKKKGIMK